MVNVLPTMNPNVFFLFYLPIAHHSPDYNYVGFFFFLPEMGEHLFNTNINWVLVLWLLLDVYHSHSRRGGMRQSVFHFVLWLLHNSPASAPTSTVPERW